MASGGVDLSGTASLRQWVEHPSPEGVEALRQALREQPEDPRLHAALGMVLADLGEVEAALDVLDHAHYLRPDSAFLLYNYGVALERAGRPREARRRYLAALRLKPDYPRVREHLARLPAERGDGPPVPEAYGRTREAEARDPAAHPVRPALSSGGGAETAVSPAVRTAAPSPGPLAPGVASPVAPSEASAPDLPYEELPPSPPPVSPDWEPEALPGFRSLGQSVLMLWFQQPLLWLGIPALPAAVLSFAVPKGGGWIAALLWLAAFSVGAGPLVAAVAAQALHGSPFAEERETAARRWLGTARMAAPLLFVVMAPFCVILGLQVAWEGWVVFLAMLTLTLPLHALLAPALVQVALHGMPAGKALRGALQRAGRRLWLYLAHMALFALGLGLLLAFMAVVAQESTRGLGHAVIRALEVGAVSLAASFWGVLVSLCGLDALAAEAAEAAKAADRERAG